MSLSVVLAGGGTTGHVAPLLALADCLHRQNPDTEITVLGTAEGLEARLVPQAGYDLTILPRAPMPRQLSADLLRLPGKLAKAVKVASAAVERADVLVGFGGYVAAPAYLAARRHGRPIVVHEANARPGLANQLGARLTSHVAVTFPGTPLRGAQVIGMPLRRQITTLDRLAQRDRARRHFGLHPDLPTLFITGGSTGAQHLNETFGLAAHELIRAGVQVLHTTGRGKTVPFPERTSPAGYVVTEYLDRMDLAYAAADFVVCRSGAGNVSEVTALGLPAAYVPLHYGNGEQRVNAEAIVAAGGGLLIDNEDCRPEWVIDVLLPLIRNQPSLVAMGRAAAAFGVVDADQRLAALVTSAADEASL